LVRRTTTVLKKSSVRRFLPFFPTFIVNSLLARQLLKHW